jgi:hypothetical protein
MIAPKLIAEIQELLDSKTYSQRRIAAMLGVSRGTVGTIAAGRRRDATPEPLCVEPPSAPSRCPGCGGMVYAPCLLCQLREASPRATARRPAVFHGTHALDLRPEHRRRYEEIRAQRQLSPFALRK